MFRSFLFVISFWLTSYDAAAQALLHLDLSQKLDPTCTGQTLLETQQAEPKQCIRYELTLQNQGADAAKQIKVNLPIPPHTQMKFAPQLFTGVSVQTVNVHAAANAYSLDLPVLPAEQQVVIQYTVQVL